MAAGGLLVRVIVASTQWRYVCQARVTPEPAVEPVRRMYSTRDETEPIAAAQLERGYEVAPGRFAVVRTEDIMCIREWRGAFVRCSIGRCSLEKVRAEKREVRKPAGRAVEARKTRNHRA